MQRNDGFTGNFLSRAALRIEMSDYRSLLMCITGTRRRVYRPWNYQRNEVDYKKGGLDLRVVSQISGLIAGFREVKPAREISRALPS